MHTQGKYEFDSQSYMVLWILAGTIPKHCVEINICNSRSGWKIQIKLDFFGRKRT